MYNCNKNIFAYGTPMWCGVCYCVHMCGCQFLTFYFWCKLKIQLQKNTRGSQSHICHPPWLPFAFQLHITISLFLVIPNTSMCVK